MRKLIVCFTAWAILMSTIGTTAIAAQPRATYFSELAVNDFQTLNENNDSLLGSELTSSEPEGNVSSSSEPTSSKPEENTSSSSEPTSSKPEENVSSSSEPTSSEPEESTSSSSEPISSEPEESTSSSSEPTSSEPEESTSSSSEPTSSEPEENTSSSSEPTSSEPEENVSSSSEPTSSESDEVDFGDVELNAVKKGWVDEVINGVPAVVYYDSNGKKLVGFHQIDGAYYLFRDDGAREWGNNGIFVYKDATYYISNGQASVGWVNYAINGKEYVSYFEPSTGKMVTGIKTIDGVTYLFRDDGGREWGNGNQYVYHDKAYFVKNGQVESGWKTYTQNGKDYVSYFDPATYAMVTGVKTIDGVTYLFRDDGGREWGNGNQYVYHDKAYFVKNGQVESGWKTYTQNGKDYVSYFDPATYAMVTGVKTIDGVAYLFRDDGGREWGNGDQYTYNGKTYFVQNGQVGSGWKTYTQNGKDYVSYFDPVSYVMATGMKKIDGKLYLFREDGGREWGNNGPFVYQDNTYCIMNGVVQTGWVQYKVNGNNVQSYFWPDTALMATGPCRVENDEYCFFTSSGERVWEGLIEYNNVQYYARDGKIVTNETIEVNGISYRADDNGVLTQISATACIDVSYHQGVINWKAVAESGIQYAIIRAVGWDRVNQTVGGVDTMFDYNVREAKKYGIKVGAYIYTYAVNTAEAQVEINAFVTAMQKLEKDGYRLDLPVFVDQEDSSLLSAMTYQQRTDQLRYQMVLLEQKGYYPGMYMSTSWSQSNVNAEQLYSEGYDMWIADYRTSVQNPVWAGRCAMWQYSSTGRVPGINGNVDMNYLYKDYSGLIQGSNNTGNEVNALFKVCNENANGAVVEDTMLNILAAIVNNEVGSGLTLTGNDRTQLYQAQAVAAHSWLMYNYMNGEALPSVGLNYSGNYSLIKTQIAAVEDQILTYGGDPILAVYGSCSNGKTNSSGDYWSTDLPYLVAGIESKYDKAMAPQYFPTTSRTRTAAELSAELKSKHGIDTSGYPDPGTWFTINGRNAGGYITSLTICGKTIKAGTLNDNFSPILTTDFEIKYDPQNQTFVFLSYGNGHCIGMSQYGAAGYIKYEGWDYQRILSHYFPNTVLTTIES